MLPPARYAAEAVPGAAGSVIEPLTGAGAAAAYVE